MRVRATDVAVTGVALALALFAVAVVADGDIPVGWACLAAVAAALAVCMQVMMRWVMRADHIFLHGYHAGFHEALSQPCPWDESEPACAVLDFSAAQARQLRRSG